MSENKPTLFDSDDEDNIEYNPDEGAEENDQFETPSASTGAGYTPYVTPSIPVIPARPVEESDEEEKIPVSAPIPFPAPAKATPQIPIPKPTPTVLPSSGDGTDIDSIFSVRDPVNTGHVTYTIRGRDEDGEFEGSRRYNGRLFNKSTCFI